MRHRLTTLIALALISVFAVSGATVRAYVDGGWPETCLEMNDMVEASAYGSGAVDIYQRAFGDNAEAACRNDHRGDIRRAFTWALGGSAPAPVSALAEQTGRVLQVYDGDTITVEHRGVLQGIRYHGVFAPELREADGPRARADNAALVPVGSTVTWQPCYTLRSRPAELRGKPQLQMTYGRVVARVFASGGSVNDTMAANMYASGGRGAGDSFPSCVPG